MDLEELARQIGPRVIFSISGGRIQWVSENLVRLPVSNGYAVEVEYNPGPDLYTVRRTFTRRPRGKRLAVRYVKGERTEVHFEQVSNAAYYAACFRSYSATEWVDKL
jgi:hypothetical protein